MTRDKGKQYSYSKMIETLSKETTLSQIFFMFCFFICSIVQSAVGTLTYVSFLSSLVGNLNFLFESVYRDDRYFQDVDGNFNQVNEYDNIAKMVYQVGKEMAFNCVYSSKSSIL